MRPYKILMFIVGLLISLAALCVVLPGRVYIGDSELRWPTISQVLGTETEREEQEDWSEDISEVWTGEGDTMRTDSSAIRDTSLIEQTQEAPQPVVQPTVKIDSTTDTRLFLQSFYASLSQTGERVVRIVHYGDSQIEEDRMTQQIREQLQDQYGGSGVGLMPLVQTIPTRTVRQELHMNGKSVKAQQGPKRYLVYGPKRAQRADGLYGVMGQMAMMDDDIVSGSEQIMAVCRPQVKSAHYDHWLLLADSTIHYTTSGDTILLSGQGAVYGLSQQSDTGIIVDNIPMRGCIGLVFTKIDSAQLATFYGEQNVRLIILQFGGNAIPFNEKPETIRGFVKGYRKQIRYLRACAPGVDIVFVGPSDMTRMKDGTWQSYPMVKYMDRLLQKMALEERIAYFSLYRWMGGEGSMNRWIENGLACDDGVHFYRSGARKAGNAIAEWILDGIDIVQDEQQEQLPDTVQLPDTIEQTVEYKEMEEITDGTH